MVPLQLHKKYQPKMKDVFVLNSSDILSKRCQTWSSALADSISPPCSPPSGPKTTTVTSTDLQVPELPLEFCPNPARSRRSSVKETHGVKKHAKPRGSKRGGAGGPKRRVRDDGTVTGQWTAQEDTMLQTAYKQYAVMNDSGKNPPGSQWGWISTQVLGRDPKSCRERYKNHLRPDLKKEPLSKAEEAQILALYRIHGKQWAKIAESFEGRTANDIKNRWHSALSKIVESDIADFVPAAPVDELNTHPSVLETVLACEDLSVGLPSMEDGCFTSGPGSFSTGSLLPSPSPAIQEYKDLGAAADDFFGSQLYHENRSSANQQCSSFVILGTQEDRPPRVVPKDDCSVEFMVKQTYSTKYVFGRGRAVTPKVKRTLFPADEREKATDDSPNVCEKAYAFDLSCDERSEELADLDFLLSAPSSPTTKPLRTQHTTLHRECDPMLLAPLPPVPTSALDTSLNASFAFNSPSPLRGKRQMRSPSSTFRLTHYMSSPYSLKSSTFECEFNTFPLSLRHEENPDGNAEHAGYTPICTPSRLLFGGLPIPS